MNKKLLSLGLGTLFMASLAHATDWYHAAQHADNRIYLVNDLNLYRPSSVEGIESHFAENSWIHLWARKDYSTPSYGINYIPFTGDATYTLMHALLKTGTVTFVGFSPNNVNMWYFYQN